MPRSETVDYLARELEACTDDPNAFNELFIGDGKQFWSRQRELVESVVKFRATACYSGNMVGKDFAIARLIWWWLYTRPGSLVIVTGPSQTLLGSVTWKEVRQAKPPLASARSEPRRQSQSSTGGPRERLAGTWIQHHLH